MKIIRLLLVVLILFSCSEEKSIIPTAKVEKGKFSVSLSEAGEIQAKKSVVVKRPTNQRGAAKVVKIVPEGTIVKKGDFLIQLDSDDLQKKVEEVENRLTSLQADLDKSDANQEFKIKQMELELENAETRFELAKMQLAKIEFESEARQQEEKLQFKITENGYIENKEKLKLQRVINQKEREVLLSKYRDAELELEQARDALEGLTITAPEDGLVVYAKLWKGDRMGKLQVGDTPWRGQELIQLPDLSEMEVSTFVNEVDVARVDTGLVVNIELDAFKGSNYKGCVSSVSRLARKDMTGGYESNVFDVIVDILEKDDKVKPGMSAKCDIIIRDYDDVTYVPVEAVFADGDKNYVYWRKKNKGSFEKKEVEILDHNDVYIALKDNPIEGEVSLVKID